MKYTRLISVLAVTMLVWGCAQPATDIDAEKAALRAAAEAYHAAGESRDFDRMASFYASDALIMPPNDEQKEGVSGTREFFASAAEIPGLSLSFRNPKVEVAASGDMGYTLADVAITAEGPDGEPVTDSERDLHVWRKEGGEWKIVLDMWNSKVPPAEAVATSASRSNDAVKVDPKHYAVELENERVRIIRIKYGPREKSVMHTHGPHVAVILTDGEIRMTHPDGGVEEYPATAGTVIWEDGGEHLPENLTDKPLEVVLVELKD